MKIVFYTATCFLDTSIEIINVLKKYLELHVLIEITQSTKNLNIINVDNLPEDQTFVAASKLLRKENYEMIEPYFRGTASTNFIVHSSKNVFTSLKASIDVVRFLRKEKPDVIHIEGITFRSFGLVPGLLFSKKLLMGVHDPVFHVGENNWKVTFARFLFFNFPIKKGYLFYSQFSKRQFEQYNKTNKHQKQVIRMKPLTFFRNLPRNKNLEKNHILFFGRLSPYKGIDVLLNAMPAVFKEFPNQKLIIAGKSIDGYEMSEELIQEYKGQIVLMNQHISNEELVRLINEAKFVVCPYLEATQSGVLMTSFALDTPVVATNVGAFPEYLNNLSTGVLVPPSDPNKLSEAIKLLLRNNYYESFTTFLKNANKEDLWDENKTELMSAYSD